MRRPVRTAHVHTSNLFDADFPIIHEDFVFCLCDAYAMLCSPFHADIPLSFPLPDELHFDSDESAWINSDAAILGSLCLRFLQNKYLFAERSVVLASVERSAYVYFVLEACGLFYFLFNSHRTLELSSLYLYLYRICGSLNGLLSRMDADSSDANFISATDAARSFLCSLFTIA